MYSLWLHHTGIPAPGRMPGLRLRGVVRGIHAADSAAVDPRSQRIPATAASASRARSRPSARSTSRSRTGRPSASPTPRRASGAMSHRRHRPPLAHAEDGLAGLHARRHARLHVGPDAQHRRGPRRRRAGGGRGRGRAAACGSWRWLTRGWKPVTSCAPARSTTSSPVMARGSRTTSPARRPARRTPTSPATSPSSPTRSTPTPSN